MNLRGVSAKLLSNGSDGPILNLYKQGKVLESLKIVPATEDHRNFILSTWVKSYQGISRRDKYEDLYLANEPAVAENRWQYSYILCSPDDEYTVHAWVCGTSDGDLWHVYVIPELRGVGISSELIRFCCGKDIRVAKPWPFARPPKGFDSWRYNPYLLQKV